MKALLLLLVSTLSACSQSVINNEVKLAPPAWPDIAQLSDQSSIPNILQDQYGDSIATVEEWNAHRPYLKQMLQHYQYGKVPEKIDSFTVVETHKEDGKKWTRLQYSFTLYKSGQSLTFRLGLIKPLAKGKYPIIIKNDRYTFDLEEIEQEKPRNNYQKQDRLSLDLWVADEATRRGYMYAKFNREDIFLDLQDGQSGRIDKLYPNLKCGAIMVWAWTYQSIIDWLTTLPFVETNRIVATGHSRGGKTALCAGIYDDRIAVTAPNSSGLGGTASMRYYDLNHEPQTIDHHAERFKHWWPNQWYKLAPHLAKLPFDAHFARALIAPRALINTHARHDYWANPYGTHLTFLKSQPIFSLYEKPHFNAMHWRDGGHGQLKEDWLALLDFCDFVFFGSQISRPLNHNPDPDRLQFDDLSAHDITKHRRTK
ncbi:MAG: hypothetical protein HKN87_15575 [Saprospiraceae bacterium]|nr:hypothetical protein [Saprospiraceae bacterium]